MGGGAAKLCKKRQRPLAASVTVACEPAANDRAGASKAPTTVEVEGARRGEECRVERVEQSGHPCKCGNAHVGDRMPVAAPLNGKAPGHLVGKGRRDRRDCPRGLTLLHQVEDPSHSAVDHGLDKCRLHFWVCKGGVRPGKQTFRDHPVTCREWTGSGVIGKQKGGKGDHGG